MMFPVAAAGPLMPSPTSLFRTLPFCSTAVLAILLFGFSLPADANSARVMAGTDRLLATPPAGATIEPYENAGYRLRLRNDGRVEVEVDLEPIRSEAPFVMPVRAEGFVPSGVEKLSRSLVSGSRTQYTAVSRILGWVASNIRYELDRAESQSAVHVLSRRSGYCTGISRLAVAMLESAGLEAREVSGYVVGETPGAPMGYHRWIEVRLDDSGWHFSDPSSSHHFVPSTYLRLASEELDLTRSHRSRVLIREEQTAEIDLYPLAKYPVVARRNSDRQRASSISFRLPERTRGRAWLSGNEELHTLEVKKGRGSFVGLPSGRYQLVVVTQYGDRFRRQVEFADPTSVQLRLTPAVTTVANRATTDEASAAGAAIDK